MKVVLTLAKKEQKALFVIFGGTGDLAQRKLYPALFDLYKRGYLKKHFALLPDPHFVTGIIMLMRAISHSQCNIPP